MKNSRLLNEIETFLKESKINKDSTKDENLIKKDKLQEIVKNLINASFEYAERYEEYSPALECILYTGVGQHIHFEQFPYEIEESNIKSLIWRAEKFVKDAQAQQSLINSKVIQLIEEKEYQDKLNKKIEEEGFLLKENVIVDGKSGYIYEIRVKDKRAEDFELDYLVYNKYPEDYIGIRLKFQNNIGTFPKSKLTKVNNLVMKKNFNYFSENLVKKVIVNYLNLFNLKDTKENRQILDLLYKYDFNLSLKDVTLLLKNYPNFLNIIEENQSEIKSKIKEIKLNLKELKREQAKK